MRCGCWEAVRSCWWRSTKRTTPEPEGCGCRGHGKEKLITNQVGVERAQKERIRRESAGTTQAGACEAPSYEVCSGEGYEETDCIMERELVELRQPGFQGWCALSTSSQTPKPLNAFSKTAR